jgi:hypothetical protein
MYQNATPVAGFSAAMCLHGLEMPFFGFGIILDMS